MFTLNLDLEQSIKIDTFQCTFKNTVMKAHAIVFDRPQRVCVRQLDVAELSAGDIEVAVDFSGISTGTERLLWNGSMPAFPGMGYPLVPGYESVGRVTAVGEGVCLPLGQTVFVPGASCWPGVHSLFGGSASRLRVPQTRVAPVDPGLGQSRCCLLWRPRLTTQWLEAGAKRHLRRRNSLWGMASWADCWPG